MNTLTDRAAADLTRSFAKLGIRAEITSDNGDIMVPSDSARQLLSSLTFHEGGSQQPFVGHLLRRRHTDVGITLHGDEGRHLWRALEEIIQARRRAERISRGWIPGSLSASEAVRLSRLNPPLGRRIVAP